MAVIVLSTATVLTGRIEDRQTAAAFMKAEKHGEAITAFVKLAEAAASDDQKIDALAQAVLCAEGLKQYDRAPELADALIEATLRWLL